MKNVHVEVARLPHAVDLPLPAYHSELAAGLDLIAAVPADAPIRSMLEQKIKEAE